MLHRRLSGAAAAGRLARMCTAAVTTASGRSLAGQISCGRGVPVQQVLSMLVRADFSAVVMVSAQTYLTRVQALA